MVTSAAGYRRYREYARNCVIWFFPTGSPGEYVCSLNGHCRGRAARDIHRTLCARAPSDVRGRGGIAFCNAHRDGFIVGAASRRDRSPVLIARILDEERTLSAELPGYDDYRRAVTYRLIPFIW